MFSNILSSVNINIESSFNISEKFDMVLKLVKESRLQYEEAKIEVQEKNIELPQYEEQLLIIEKERLKLMSELASQMETQEDLKKKVKDLKNTLQTTEISLKKYSKMKPKTADLKTLAHTKKIFGIYKNQLNMYFDFANSTNKAILRGYLFDKTTKKLKYFEVNKNEQTPEEILKYMRNTIESVSI